MINLAHTQNDTLWQHSSAAAGAVTNGWLLTPELSQHCTPSPRASTIRHHFQITIHCWHAHSHPALTAEVACYGTMETQRGVQKPTSRSVLLPPHSTISRGTG